MDVLGVKSSSPLSQGLDVREAEEQFNTEVRFGLMAGLTDEPLTGGDSHSARENLALPLGLRRYCISNAISCRSISASILSSASISWRVMRDRSMPRVWHGEWREVCQAGLMMLPIKTPGIWP